ncbi:MAG: hypothetical protein KGL39_39515 [Patescibacteria group bacterium]|nr:hypothetical protein [Patescibacteria group bacterium]
MGSTCATGYSRVAPHVCQQQCTECQGLTQFTADNACHAIDLHAAYNYPNTIAQGLGHLKIYNLAINSANVAFYTLSNCTGTAYLTANGIAGFQPVYMFPVQVMSGNIYYKTVNGAGGNYGVIQPVDYYD